MFSVVEVLVNFELIKLAFPQKGHLGTTSSEFPTENQNCRMKAPAIGGFEGFSQWRFNPTKHSGNLLQFSCCHEAKVSTMFCSKACCH